MLTLGERQGRIHEALDADQIRELRLALGQRVAELEKLRKKEGDLGLGSEHIRDRLRIIDGDDTTPGLMAIIAPNGAGQGDVFYDVEFEVEEEEDADGATPASEPCPHANVRTGETESVCTDCGQVIPLLRNQAGEIIEGDEEVPGPAGVVFPFHGDVVVTEPGDQRLLVGSLEEEGWVTLCDEESGEEIAKARRDALRWFPEGDRWIVHLDQVELIAEPEEAAEPEEELENLEQESPTPEPEEPADEAEEPARMPKSAQGFVPTPELLEEARLHVAKHGWEIGDRPTGPVGVTIAYVALYGWGCPTLGEGTLVRSAVDRRRSYRVREVHTEHVVVEYKGVRQEPILPRADMTWGGKGWNTRMTFSPVEQEA